MALALDPGFLPSVSRHRTKFSDSHDCRTPTLAFSCRRRAAQLSPTKLFFAAAFTKGGGHFFPFDARPRIAALAEILLFGAVTHHAGMSNLSPFLGLFKGRCFLLHAKYSVRDVRWRRGKVY